MMRSISPWVRLKLRASKWYPFPSRYFSAAVSPSRPKRVVCIVYLLDYMALSDCLVSASETILYSILYPPRRFVNERTSVYANGINNDFLMKKSNSRAMVCYYFPHSKETTSAIARSRFRSVFPVDVFGIDATRRIRCGISQARSFPARRLISRASDAGT